MNVNDEITVALVRINLSILIETKYCMQRKLTRIQHEWNTVLTLVHFHHNNILFESWLYMIWAKQLVGKHCNP